MKALDFQKVSVRFGTVQALKRVDVSVRAGEVVMLAGPNGAGKSTLLGVLLGLVRADQGALFIDGVAREVDHTLKRAMGYLPEAVAFSESLSGRQVGRFFASARGVAADRVDAMLDRVGLTQAARRPIRGYSRGMRQRLGLGLAILHEPELLLLDEPTGGLDQEGLALLWSILEQWRRLERMVLLSSHDLTLLERRVQRICVLRGGEVLADASPEGLRELAPLPVQVRFDLGDEADFAGLQRVLEQRLGARRALRQGQRLLLQVTPAELLVALEVAGRSAQGITAVRVEEPGLDQIYEHLLAGGGAHVTGGSAASVQGRGGVHGGGSGARTAQTSAI